MSDVPIRHWPGTGYAAVRFSKGACMEQFDADLNYVEHAHSTEGTTARLKAEGYRFSV